MASQTGVLWTNIRKAPLRVSAPMFSQHHSKTRRLGWSQRVTGAYRSFSNSSEGGEKPKSPIESRLKNPIVHRLWSDRHEAKMRLNKSSGDELRLNVGEEPKGKFPRESETVINYPFSSDELFAETYRSPWGEIRCGRLLEDLDAMAGNVAFHHVDGNPLIVTAGVDRIRVRGRPSVDKDQQLSGRVTWTGSSSMEIRMEVKTVGEENEWLEAFFTFVTLDPESHKPIQISHLVPETNQERVQFEMGALKAKSKKAARKNKLKVGEQLTETSLQLDKIAAELLTEGKPLVRMPSLADSTAILMEHTKMQNAMIAQPQVRNMHGRIFGGFLMRRAFELAFATAYVFGGEKPQFLEVDEVSFNAPVDVGDLLVFDSRVVYTLPDGDIDGTRTGAPLVMIEVKAFRALPEEVSATVSNHFYFTFALPTKTTCKRILPENTDEARLMASRMHANKEQALYDDNSYDM